MAQNPNIKLPMSEVFNHLLSSLPDEYIVTCDTINASGGVHTISTKAALDHLEQKEDSLVGDKNEEAAHMAWDCRKD